MAFGGRKESTQSTAEPLRGIEPSRADPSWAKVVLSSALIASSPRVLSVDVPDRIAPIVRAHLILERKNTILLESEGRTPQSLL